MDCDCDIRDCICEPKKNPAAVALGALGGKARTKKKIEAARRNGKKGGRRKTTK